MTISDSTPPSTRGKIIILSAPSGAGKSSIISKLMQLPKLRLGFSISCTSRLPRGNEQDGKDYYFVTPEEFKKRVENDEFVEWEEVYSGTCYGTLRSEVARVTDAGLNLIMDVDVKGGINIKKYFGDNALSIFIMPPGIEELERRLRNRATDSEETIAKRLAKAEYEISFAPEFDETIINEDLEEASAKAGRLISKFITPDK